MPSRAISIDTIIHDLKASSQRQAYQQLCEIAAPELGLDAAAMLRRIMEKERMNADSSVGGGVALPYTRSLKVQKSHSILARLEKPLDDLAPDGTPVHLICLTLFPRTGSMKHLTELARLSRHLKDPALQQKIINAQSPDAIRSVLMDPDGWMLAA